jgi:threonine dehydrogenase-like Zn-dependent dehydrogenase
MSEALAEAAVGALAPDATPVEVVGETSLGEAVRARLGHRAAGAGRPAAVIETTGNRDEIEAALRRVDDLGTVVLAGPPPPGPVPLDLYADLHVRGLTLVGVVAPGRQP